MHIAFKKVYVMSANSGPLAIKQLTTLRAGTTVLRVVPLRFRRGLACPTLSIRHLRFRFQCYPSAVHCF